MIDGFHLGLNSFIGKYLLQNTDNGEKGMTDKAIGIVLVVIGILLL